MPDNSNNEEQLGYKDAAFTYWDRGWRGIIPITRGTKGGSGANLPVGRTGKAGIDPSYPDVHTWTETRGYDNLILRLPDDIIGIDVDNYGAKNGGQTITEAEKRWGKLPPTVRTTSRDDGINGIRIYKVPAGTHFLESINFIELGLGDIEIIQRTHRYAVSFPSIHPEKRPYQWRNDNNQVVEIPWRDNTAPLPDTWVANLTAPPATLGPVPVPGVGYDVAEALTTGDLSPGVAARLTQAITELNIPGVCHHDCTRDHALALLRMGKNGETGVHSALAALGEIFVGHVKDNRAGGAAEVKREFKNLIFGPGAARELAQPGNDDWVRNLIVDTTEAVKAELAAVKAETSAVQPSEATVDDIIAAAQTALDSGDDEAAGKLFDQAVLLEQQQTQTQPAALAAAPVQPVQKLVQQTCTTSGQPDLTKSDTYRNEFQEQLEILENGFWNSRASLRNIFDAALSRWASPWAVLAGVLARSACLIPPRIQLPPIVGGNGSLNHFYGLTGVSGGGKGAAINVAKELTPSIIYEGKIGSGEGFINILQGNPRDPDSRRESVWFDAGEIDLVKAMGDRSGSTLDAILRDAWMGASIGFGYKESSFVEAHSYRVTVTLGIQPRRAAWLLADGGGGTPQRLTFVPAEDDQRANRANKAAMKGYWISPVALPNARTFLYPRVLQVPQGVVDDVEEFQERKGWGLVDEFDTHSAFARMKIAQAMAFIDGRADMDMDDWALAGVMSQVSVLTRESIFRTLRKSRVAEAEERGDVRGVEMWSADQSRDLQRDVQFRRVTRWLVGRLTEAGTDGLTKSEITEAVSGRDRKCLGEVLVNMAGDGLVRSGLDEGSSGRPAERWWLR